MNRARPEWIGVRPDTPVPMRVKLRILELQHERCRDCGRKFDGKLKPEFDHRPALINGGENRENMIFAVCGTCHAAHTRTDLAEKSKVAALKASRLGIRPKSRWPKRPMRLIYKSNTRDINEEQ